MTATTTPAYYLLETSGDVRRMWSAGVSLRAAAQQSGSRHIVVTGSACRDGRSMRRGEVEAAIEHGSIVPVDTSRADIARCPN